MSLNVTNSSLSTGADMQQGFENLFTGNLDYSRNLQLLIAEQKFNEAEAQKQRDFEEYMSSTSYSRALKDLEGTGLNPYYILSGGGGASTPSGASAQSSASSFRSVGGSGWQLLGNLIGMGLMVATRGVGVMKTRPKPIGFGR